MTRYPEIVFGTDGWRAQLGQVFTTDRVFVVANAIADYVLALPKKQGRTVVVGYDARFQADAFAKLVANILADKGLNVVLGATPVATP